ncbi:MAG: site-specific DNA-methyltransferase [Pyrinomonadaceae bacterium]
MINLMPNTPDLNAERLAALKELFPDLFTDEGNLNETELKKLVDPRSVNETERYEFRWFGKSDAKRKAFTPTTATLNYDAARSVHPIRNAHGVSVLKGEEHAYCARVSDERVSENTSENLIIEGENLKVLKLLLCGYREQIKCIYIDPPYNTGKDFVYSDNYSEDRLPYWKQTNVVNEYGVKVDTNADTDGRYHSNWMNMMFSRLLVARQLLRKDGVIFISIDDNEVHNLRRLCNEVFGADNFVSNIIWHSKYTTSNDAKYISRQHESVLMYAKELDSFEIGLLDRTAEMDAAYSNPDKDKRGVWKATPLHAKSGSRNYVAKFSNGVEWTAPQGRYPRYSETKIQELYEDNRIHFGKAGTTPSVKTFLSEVKQGKTVGSIWSFDKVGSSHQANEQIAQVFGKGIFENPKPTGLIKTCIKTANAEGGIILDFFAGSGTTGQAVMELNEADGGNRKFILVQLPELTDEKSEAYKAGYKRISDITIERNRRVVEKLIAEREANHPNLFNQIRNAHGVSVPNDETNVSNGETNVSNDETNVSNGEEHAYSVRVSDEASAANLGFKVFRLEKSYFPRAEWNPDPDASEAENVQSLKDYIAEKEARMLIDFDRDKLLTEILLKEGFKLNYKIRNAREVSVNSATDEVSVNNTSGGENTLTAVRVSDNNEEDTLTAVRVSDNKILRASDGEKEALICLDDTIEPETVEYFKTRKDLKFICLERALDTTKKWNLANSLGEKFKAF